MNTLLALTPDGRLRHSYTPHTPRHRALHLALQAAFIGMLLAPALPMTAHAAPAAAKDEARIYRIAAGPLGDVLANFAAAADVQISFDAALLARQQSPGLQGRYTVTTGFTQLLANTGFELLPLGDGRFSVRRVGDQALPLVTVNGDVADAEQARGPVEGFIARRSAAGTKTDTPLLETPQSISVIGRQQMEDRNVQTINEALRYSAGVGTYYSNDTRNDAFTLRGFSADYNYLDGTRLTAVPGRALDQWRIDPYQLERVEVVKGPASAVFGLGEPGGVVNMVSKLPTVQARHQIDFFVGNYDRYGVGIDTSGPVDEAGTVLYRFVGLQSSSRNQVDYVHGTRTLLAPSLTLRPSRDTSLTLTATYLRDNTMDSNNFYPRIGTVVPTASGLHIPTGVATSDPGYENYDKTQYSLGYIFDQRINDNWSFRQNFRFAHLDLDNQALFGFRLLADQQTILRAAMNLRSNYNNLDLDNQLQGKLVSGDIEHTLLFGFNLSNQNYTDMEGYDYGYPLNLYNPVYANITKPEYNDTRMRQVQTQAGLYAQDQIKIARKWIVALSGRQDWVRTRTSDDLAVSSTSQSDSAFSGRAGLMYLFEQGVSPYVSYSTSFLPQSGVDAYRNPYKPLKSRQAEAGVKYQPTGMNATFTAAVFDLHQKNSLSAVPDPALTGSVQVGETRSRGIELEATAELTDSLKLLAAYTYQDVRVTEGSSADTTVGKRPTATPTNLASMWLDYTFHRGPLSGLGMGAGVQYVGPTWGDSANTDEVKSFTLLDAALRYSTGPWRFNLSANNLLDRIYVSRCGNDTRCQYGQRRSLTFSGRYSW